MSNRNNTQRRTARRFKRTQRATQHHQRGRINGELCLIIGLIAFMALCVGVLCGSITYAIQHADCAKPTARIDWEQVPVEPPTVICDLRTTRSGCITSNQRALRREAKRVYAALAFERVRS